MVHRKLSYERGIDIHTMRLQECWSTTGLCNLETKLVHLPQGEAHAPPRTHDGTGLPCLREQ